MSLKVIDPIVVNVMFTVFGTIPVFECLEVAWGVRKTWTLAVSVIAQGGLNPCNGFWEHLLGIQALGIVLRNDLARLLSRMHQLHQSAMCVAAKK
jgi:hypothetical protein